MLSIFLSLRSNLNFHECACDGTCGESAVHNSVVTYSATIRTHASTSRAWPRPLGRYLSAYQYNAMRFTRTRRRYLYHARRPSSRVRESLDLRSTSRVTMSGNAFNVADAALRTTQSESSSIAITAAACCASVAGSSLPSVSNAAWRTCQLESSSLAITASACCVSVAGSSLPSRFNAGSVSYTHLTLPTICSV